MGQIIINILLQVSCSKLESSEDSTLSSNLSMQLLLNKSDNKQVKKKRGLSLNFVQ